VVVRPTGPRDAEDDPLAGPRVHRDAVERAVLGDARLTPDRVDDILPRRRRDVPDLARLVEPGARHLATGAHEPLRRSRIDTNWKVLKAA
jgi:hypothetical protein